MYTHTQHETSGGNGWQTCGFPEHLREVRKWQEEVARRVEEISEPEVLELVQLHLAAVGELVDHAEGLHEDDVLLRLLEG